MSANNQYMIIGYTQGYVSLTKRNTSHDQITKDNS